jgi:hypothetical protein
VGPPFMRYLLLVTIGFLHRARSKTTVLAVCSGGESSPSAETMVRDKGERIKSILVVQFGMQ